MADLSSVASLTSGITSISNLVLVTPTSVVGYQPMSGTKSAGNALVFQTEGENTVSLESEITDHAIDSNSQVQDHVAVRPETITVQGFIGELSDMIPNAKLAALAAQVQQKMTTLSAYAPALTNEAIQAYNEAFYAYQLGAAAVSAGATTLNTLTGSSGAVVIGASGIDSSAKAAPQNKQQQMFQQFYTYWRNRVLFTVQTPWANFTNCAILRLRSIQDQETQLITSFEITFKPLRFVNTVTTKYYTTDDQNFSSHANIRGSSEQDNGISAQGSLVNFDPTKARSA